MSAMLESVAHTSMDLEPVSVLPWVPWTTSAVSLRLFEFEASILYVQLEKPEPREEKEAREYIVSLFQFLSVIRLLLLLNFYDVWYYPERFVVIMLRCHFLLLSKNNEAEL